MILTKPAKKPRKRKAKKTKESATQTPKTPTPKRTRKATAPTALQTVVPVAVSAPADLSEITPARLAALSASQFKHGAIFGPAGSGKTHLVREALKINPRWGLLTATTGAPPYYYRHLPYPLPQAAQLLWTRRLMIFHQCPLR